MNITSTIKPSGIMDRTSSSESISDSAEWSDSMFIWSSTKITWNGTRLFAVNALPPQMSIENTILSMNVKNIRP